MSPGRLSWLAFILVALAGGLWLYILYHTAEPWRRRGVPGEPFGRRPGFSEFHGPCGLPRAASPLALVEGDLDRRIMLGLQPRAAHTPGPSTGPRLQPLPLNCVETLYGDQAQAFAKAGDPVARLFLIVSELRVADDYCGTLARREAELLDLVATPVTPATGERLRGRFNYRGGLMPEVAVLVFYAQEFCGRDGLAATGVAFDNGFDLGGVRME